MVSTNNCNGSGKYKKMLVHNGLRNPKETLTVILLSSTIKTQILDFIITRVLNFQWYKRTRTRKI